MIDPKKIEQIARQVHESMPKESGSSGKMWRKKSAKPYKRADASRSGKPRRIRRSDASPVRTREKLALLEQRISELEARIIR